MIGPEIDEMYEADIAMRKREQANIERWTAVSPHVERYLNEQFAKRPDMGEPQWAWRQRLFHPPVFLG